MSVIFPRSLEHVVEFNQRKLVMMKFRKTRMRAIPSFTHHLLTESISQERSASVAWTVPKKLKAKNNSRMREPAADGFIAHPKGCFLWKGLIIGFVRKKR